MENKKQAVNPDMIGTAGLRQLADAIVATYDIHSTLTDDETTIFLAMKKPIDNFFKAALKANRGLAHVAKEGK